MPTAFFYSALHAQHLTKYFQNYIHGGSKPTQPVLTALNDTGHVIAYTQASSLRSEIDSQLKANFRDYALVGSAQNPVVLTDRTGLTAQGRKFAAQKGITPTPQAFIELAVNLK